MTFYLTNQSFRSKRSLISGVSFTTKTILNSQKVKTQKAKVAAESKSGCSHSHSETHEAFIIKKIGLEPPVLAPLLFSSLCPKSLLTEAKKASSLGPSCCPLFAPVSYLLTLEGEAADFPHN